MSLLSHRPIRTKKSKGLTTSTLLTMVEEKHLWSKLKGYHCQYLKSRAWMDVATSVGIFSGKSLDVRNEKNAKQKSARGKWDHGHACLARSWQHVYNFLTCKDVNDDWSSQTCSTTGLLTKTLKRIYDAMIGSALTGRPTDTFLSFVWPCNAIWSFEGGLFWAGWSITESSSNIIRLSVCLAVQAGGRHLT